MKLLIITQKVDRNDPILGFFHRWIEEFAKNFQFVTVICLEAGEYDFPTNVKVLSLGKPYFANFYAKATKFKKASQGKGGKVVSKFIYVWRFYKYIWQERRNYDVVFVHMNQEYVLLGWKFWKLWGKKIFLWRNHAKGNLLTRLAVLLSNKVFYTSPQSFTARFKKAEIMPVGIDTDFFKPDPSVVKKPNSILFLGRIAPVKGVLEFIEWLKNQNFSYATIAGSTLPRDINYEKDVRKKVSAYGLSGKVKFIGAVTQDEVPKLYQSHETYVNFTPSGSMDKTILEAGACETAIIVENSDLKILEAKSGKELRDFVIENHSLDKLMKKLNIEI